MIIGIDMLGLQAPSRITRIGGYCFHLLQALFERHADHEYVLYRHDGLPTDGLPAGTNTSIRTLPRDPGGNRHRRRPLRGSSPPTRTAWTRC